MLPRLHNSCIEATPYLRALLVCYFNMMRLNRIYASLGRKIDPPSAQAIRQTPQPQPTSHSKNVKDVQGKIDLNDLTLCNIKLVDDSKFEQTM